MGPYVSHLPGITSLKLRDAVFDAFSSLTSTVSALPHLQNLTLVNISVTIVDEAPPQQDKRVLAELRSLQSYDDGEHTSDVHRRLLGWLASLPRRPPLEHITVGVRVADISGTPTPFGNYLSISNDELTSLVIVFNPKDLARNGAQR